MQFLHLNNQKGTSLLDVVFGTAILLIVFIGLYGAFQLTLDLVQSSKSKTGALALTNERMEFIRSLKYDDVGTVGGIPQGILEETETKTLNGIGYTRRTFVQYFDDPGDGIGVADTNGITTDYKIVKVDTQWQFRGNTRSFSLVTNVVPKGIETTSGGGTLRVTVFNSIGSPVPSAQVNLINNALTPAVSLSTFTNTSGVVEFPGAPSSSNSYEVVVSKTNYSSAKTYSVSGANPNPNPGHLTVANGQTTSSSFAIDVLGLATINTFKVGTTTPLKNIALSIRGDKTIGVDSVGNPVYKYSSSINTGSSGSVAINNLEWDNYTITIDDAVTGYDIAEICVPQPFALSPAENETVNIYLTTDALNSLLVNVKDNNGNVLNNAVVQLYRGAYDTTIATGSCGQSFFNNSVSKGTVGGGNPYTLDVSLSGYITKTINSIEIDGASLSSIILNK